MSDPTSGAGPKSPEEVFDEIGASIPDEDTAPTLADVEGTTEPVAPETPAAEAQPRDEQGRFSEKGVAAPDAAATPVVAASPGTPAPTPSAEAQPSAPDLSQYPTYEYRVAGQAIPFQGAIRGSDGVLIPNDALPQLERMLAEAHQAHHTQSQSGRREAELKRQVQAANEEKNTVLGRMAEIMADPAKFDAWAADTQRNWEKLVLEARLKMAEQDRDNRASQYEEVASEQEVQALIPQLHSAAEESVRQFASSAEFKDLALDAEWQRDFKARLLESQFDRLFTEATADDVRSGIAQQIGQTVFHPEPILAEIRYQAAFARRELTRQKALAEAAQRNQARLPAPALVPTAGAKPTGSPVSKPKPALKPGMSRDDVDKLVFETMMED